MPNSSAVFYIFHTCKYILYSPPTPSFIFSYSYRPPPLDSLLHTLSPSTPHPALFQLQTPNRHPCHNLPEAFRGRKISSSSISTCSVDKQMKNETSQLKQEEGPPIVEHSVSHQQIGSSRQPAKFNKNDRICYKML